MANRRYIRLDKYGISVERYKELSAFTMQYKEWQDGLAHSKDSKLSDKINLVKQIAEKSSIETIGDDGMKEYIIKNVTEERPYYYLKEIMRMPYRDKDFYSARKKFYVNLNEAKE